MEIPGAKAYREIRINHLSEEDTLAKYHAVSHQTKFLSRCFPMWQANLSGRCRSKFKLLCYLTNTIQI